MAAESLVDHAHNGTGQGVLLDVPDMKSGGTVFVADHGETIFAQGGDAAEVVGGDAPMGQTHATKHIGCRAEADRPSNNHTTATIRWRTVDEKVGNAIMPRGSFVEHEG